MKQIKVFDEGERVHFLKKGAKISVNGTDYQFLYQWDGIVVRNNFENNTVEVKADGYCYQPRDIIDRSSDYKVYQVPNEHVFGGPHSKAGTYCDEFNGKLIKELRKVLDDLEEDYT
jgi:hypothetical protein